MSSVLYTIAILAVTLSVPALAAVDANKAIDFRADRLRVEGGKKSMALVGAKHVQQTSVTEGETIGLVCDVSAHLVAGAGYLTTQIANKLQAVIQRDGKTLGFGPVIVRAVAELGPMKQEAKLGKSFAASTDVFKWTAQEPGQHEFTCEIRGTGFQEPTLENNIATAIVVVLPKPQKMLRSPSTESNSANQHASPASGPNVGGGVQSATKVPAIQAPVMSAVSPALALADIVSDGTVTVGTKPVAWGGIVAVNAAESRIIRNGMCEFAVRHVVRNAGAGAAGAFNRLWTNSNVAGKWEDSYPPIPAGGAVERVDTLPLKPGRNVLYLKLDPNNTVAESNENNNLNRIAIELSGECGAPVSNSPGSSGGRLKLPKS